jgi:hypothetical protein
MTHGLFVLVGQFILPSPTAPMKCEMRDVNPLPAHSLSEKDEKNLSDRHIVMVLGQLAHQRIYIT